MPPRDDEPLAVDARVRDVLAQGVSRVQTPAAADAVIDSVERLAAGQTEQQAADAAGTGAAAAAVVDAAATGPPRHEDVAEVLAAAAADSVAAPADPTGVGAVVQAALEPGAEPASPAARRGRSLLRAAVLRRMGPLQALDARLYLAVNEAPHPGWLDRLGWLVAVVAVGGWVWSLGAAAAFLLGVPRGGRALKLALPCVIGATLVVDYPLKTFFRRRRPFIDIVRALVVGKKPGSWSFPSGHTASSFAGAWVLSTVWRRQAPLFLTLATGVGVSRVYVGAHYPGDVLVGALAGLSLAEVIRQATKRLLRL